MNCLVRLSWAVVQPRGCIACFGPQTPVIGQLVCRATATPPLEAVSLTLYVPRTFRQTLVTLDAI